MRCTMTTIVEELVNPECRGGGKDLDYDWSDWISGVTPLASSAYFLEGAQRFFSGRGRFCQKNTFSQRDATPFVLQHAARYMRFSKGAEPPQGP